MGIAREIEVARSKVRQAVNSAMVQSYWQIGRLIVEHELQGESRAAYGKQQLQALSQRLTVRLAKGFDVTNLRAVRRFYEVFPIRDTLSLELGWSHFRRLMRVDNEQARAWYLQETIKQGWSARAMDRQISKLYYERLLASQDRHVVEVEAEAQTQPLTETAKDYLRDPYILDFLNLDDKSYQKPIWKRRLSLTCSSFCWSWARASPLWNVSNVSALTMRTSILIWCSTTSS